jgi:hypothetical protein
MALRLLEKEIKTKNKVSADIVFQLALTLFALYVANNMSIDLWRSIRGH